VIGNVTDEDTLALMLGARRLRPQCWRAAALLAGITWGPAQVIGLTKDTLALMLGARRLRPQCWRAAALLAGITWGPAQVIAKTLSH